MFSLIFIPLSILFLPWLLVRFVLRTKETQKLKYGQAAQYLAPAAALWIISFFLPNIPVSDETTTFSQHATGGVLAAILFWYFARAYRWRFSYRWQEPLALYFFVGGLGVANELFELAVTKMGLIWIDGSDVWWDLLANTLGAALAFGAVLLFRHVRH
jgi:hypothetical protein